MGAHAVVCPAVRDEAPAQSRVAVIAVDTGVFVALADRSDAWHQAAVRRLDTLDEGWITTWPVLTEASHLLMRRLGVGPVLQLLQDVVEGGLALWAPPPQTLARMPALMRKYAKLPMDLADASLVLLAEDLGHGRILSTDLRDFGAYRWKSRKPFDNLLELP
jgi:predicted nucleic acid-binding protein